MYVLCDLSLFKAKQRFVIESKSNFILIQSQANSWENIDESSLQTVGQASSGAHQEGVLHI